ncbi:MAG TPA: helix-turn-helix transcriptional regulator [Campylobacterales bacterium]|nr:helix-turn-helix transcriptional regulator [Campylobacterales bacterium]
MSDHEDLFAERVKQAHIQIGKNVQKIRKSKKLSQLKLSLAMGYNSVSVVSCAEIYHNNIHFNIEHLVKIADILQVDIKDLFDGIKTIQVED